MGRPKKEKIEEPKMEYKLKPYILDKICPLVKKNLNKIEEIISKENISKEEWTFLKDLAIEFCKAAVGDISVINAFNLDKVKSIRYKEKHSNYYYGNIEPYRNGILNKIWEYQHNGNKESYLHIIAVHIFYYVIFPEKN